MFLTKSLKKEHPSLPVTKLKNVRTPVILLTDVHISVAAPQPANNPNTVACHILVQGDRH